MKGGTAQFRALATDRANKPGAGGAPGHHQRSCVARNREWPHHKATYVALVAMAVLVFTGAGPALAAPQYSGASRLPRCQPHACSPRSRSLTPVLMVLRSVAYMCPVGHPNLRWPGLGPTQATNSMSRRAAMGFISLTRLLSTRPRHTVPMWRSRWSEPTIPSIMKTCRRPTWSRITTSLRALATQGGRRS
jgi:hypothetical protein